MVWQGRSEIHESNDPYVHPPVLSTDEFVLDNEGRVTLPVKISIPDNSFTKAKYNILPGYLDEMYLDIWLPDYLDLDTSSGNLKWATENGEFKHAGSSQKFGISVVSLTEYPSSQYPSYHESGKYYQIALKVASDYESFYTQNWETCGAAEGVAFSLKLRVNRNFKGGNILFVQALYNGINPSYAHMKMILNTPRDVRVDGFYSGGSAPWNEGDVPEFSIDPVTLKAGANTYTDLRMKTNNLPISNVKMDIYLPEGISTASSTFGLGRYIYDPRWEYCTYNSSTNCVSLSVGSQTGRYSFEDDDDDEFFNFKVIASSSFNKSGQIIVKNVRVTYLGEEIALGDFTGIVNFNNQKEVTPGAPTFSAGDFMTPGQFEMLGGGKTVDIPVRMETSLEVNRITLYVDVPDGLTVKGIRYNEDVLPSYFLERVQAGYSYWRSGSTNKGYALIVYADPYPNVNWNSNYWHASGTAPTFYITVESSASFQGGVITIHDAAVGTTSTNSASIICADATCSVSVINIGQMELSTPYIEHNLAGSNTYSLPVSARWDGRDDVNKLRFVVSYPAEFTLTDATLNPIRSYGHTVSVTSLSDTQSRVTISNYDSSSYLICSYGELVTLNFSVASGFEEGMIAFVSAEASTKYYPSWSFTDVNGFAPICMYDLGGSALVGDMDGNGLLEVNDVVILADLAMGGGATAEQLAIGDLDGSGTIDVNDVVMLAEMVMGS